MNLCLDIGNSLVKAALFERNELQLVERFSIPFFSSLDDFCTRNQSIENVMVSNVNVYEAEIDAFLKTKFSTVFYLKSSTSLPFNNFYKTKETIGADRIAAVSGAKALFPNRNVLIADFGTAITYEFLDAEGNYHGGNISPGLHLRFKALHHFTGKLPLLSQSENHQLIGNSTESAIISGVQNGILFETENYIKILQEKFSNLQVVFTGGDAQFLADKIKNRVICESNLVLIGLNEILLYNIELNKLK